MKQNKLINFLYGLAAAIATTTLLFGSTIQAAPTDTVRLYMSPADSNVVMGDVLSTQLRLKIETSSRVNQVNVYVSYSASIVEVLSISTEGGVFPPLVTPSFNNGNGTLQVQVRGDVITGPIDTLLATVRFRAKAAGAATVAYTSATVAGTSRGDSVKDLLSTASGARISVTPPIATPVTPKPRPAPSTPPPTQTPITPSPETPENPLSPAEEEEQPAVLIPDTSQGPVIDPSVSDPTAKPTSPSPSIMSRVSLTVILSALIIILAAAAMAFLLLSGKKPARASATSITDDSEWISPTVLPENGVEDTESLAPVDSNEPPLEPSPTSKSAPAISPPTHAPETTATAIVTPNASPQKPAVVSKIGPAEPVYRPMTASHLPDRKKPLTPPTPAAPHTHAAKPSAPTPKPHPQTTSLPPKPAIDSGPYSMKLPSKVIHPISSNVAAAPKAVPSPATASVTAHTPTNKPAAPSHTAPPSPNLNQNVVHAKPAPVKANPAIFDPNAEPEDMFAAGEERLRAEGL